MTPVAGDTTHTFTATANSGSGKNTIGIAGSFAMNLVSDRTEAYVPATAQVAAGTGDVTVTRHEHDHGPGQGHREGHDDLGQLGRHGGSGSSNVGVGASVALNLLLTNVTRAEIVDGAGAHRRPRRHDPAPRPPASPARAPARRTPRRSAPTPRPAPRARSPSARRSR